MPIIVKINPVRVEVVQVETNSPIAEDVLLSVWPIVRAHLKRLDRDLEKNARRFIRTEAHRPGTLLTGGNI